MVTASACNLAYSRSMSSPTTIDSQCAQLNCPLEFLPKAVPVSLLLRYKENTIILLQVFLSMYHIAIVDDNETWCFVLALRLQQQGYAVSTFTDTQAFLQEVDQFDLVLVDFSIPTPRYQRHMDGPEVICQVKHQLDNSPLLILISSFFTKDLLDHAMDICPEADAVMSKQTDLTGIFSKIQQLLANRTPVKQTHDRTRLSKASAGAEFSTHA